jgi:AcrR family transcriptional regulator
MNKQPRARRSTEELRAALLDSARGLFSERGFAATSTRDIAQRAGAVEHLIFKHFGSKAGLCAAAVFEPLAIALNEQLVRLRDSVDQADDVEHRITGFVEMLLPSLRENRRLLIAYLDAVTFHEDSFSSLGAKPIPSLIEYLLRLEQVHKDAPARTRIVVEDPLMETRLSFALVFAVVMFEDLLFAPDEQDPRRELSSIVKLLSTGLGADPSSRRKPSGRKQGKAMS